MVVWFIGLGLILVLMWCDLYNLDSPAILGYIYYYQLFLCCRKKKAVHKTTTTDDKRLQSTLKRIGVNAIPAIEEVNIFKDDVVIQFLNPKGKSFPALYFVCMIITLWQ